MDFFRNPAGPPVRNGGPATFKIRQRTGCSFTVEYSTDLTHLNPATTSESAGAADSNGVRKVAVPVSNPALNGKLIVRVQAQ